MQKERADFSLKSRFLQSKQKDELASSELGRIVKQEVEYASQLK